MKKAAEKQGSRADAKPEPKPKGKPGRPCKLTPEVHTAIVERMRNGSFLEHAARLSGVHPVTVWRWLEQGDEEGAPEPYASFATDFRRAEAEAEENAKEQLRTWGGVEWKATLAFLERRFPDRWGPKSEQRIQHEGAMVQVYLPDNGRDGG
jgi:transposase